MIAMTVSISTSVKACFERGIFAVNLHFLRARRKGHMAARQKPRRHGRDPPQLQPEQPLEEICIVWQLRIGVNFQQTVIV